MPVPPSPFDPLDGFIREWCQRWKLHEHFASIPARNLLGRARQCRAVEQPDPLTFVHDCAGVPLDPAEWEPIHRATAFFVGDPQTGRREQVSGIGSGAKVTVEVPELTWNPLEEMLPEALTRIVASIEPIVRSELNRVRDEYIADGYQPVHAKDDTQHFEWLARYQILGETKRDIARAEGVSERHVRRELELTARLLGIHLRPQRPGRPRRKTGHTIKIRKSRN